MHLLSLKIMLGVIFGSGEDELAREIAGVFSREIYQDLGSWSVWTRFSHLHPRFRELIAAEVRRRRSAAGPGRSSLFDALGRRLGTRAGNFTSEEEIEDHIFTLLVAGVDPTALVISWALYAIHEEPRGLARLRERTRQVGPEVRPDARGRAALSGRDLPGDHSHAPDSEHAVRAEARSSGRDRTDGDTSRE